MRKLVEEVFKNIGYEIITYNQKENANGVDMWVKTLNGNPKSVEIKKARKLKNNTYQCSAVEKNRLNDDIIAIVINNYVLVEPMQDHLKCCAPKGTRNFTIMCK